MSRETSKTILRQWAIIRFLLVNQYVSTSSIREHLQGIGIDAELRTLQRDLNLLERVMPIECRRDSMPHSWRWKKVQETQTGYLNMTQALTLRLVEEQLKDVMSAKLIAELQPLFIRARLVTGMASELEQLEDAGRSNIPKDTLPDRSRGGYGITGAPSPVTVILHGMRSLIGSALALVTPSPSEKPSNNMQMLDAAICELMEVMRKEGLDELVDNL